MFHIVLHAPKIPPNTGNIIRLCANTGFRLHLIEPLGFSLGEKHLRRAGLDYHQAASVKTWPNWQAFREACNGRLITFSTRSSRLYTAISYQAGDYLVFGSETEGLPDEVFNQVDLDCQATIPMWGHSRSLNLSNSVAIVAYEAWRQQGFGDTAGNGDKEYLPQD